LLNDRFRGSTERRGMTAMGALPPRPLAGFRSACQAIRSPPMAATPLPIRVNRAPVCTLWATVVTERLGYPPETTRTLGRFAAGSSTRVKTDVPLRAPRLRRCPARSPRAEPRPDLREGNHELWITAGRVYRPYHRHARVPAIPRLESAARALADPADRRSLPPRHPCLRFCSTGDPGTTGHTRFGGRSDPSYRENALDPSRGAAC